MRQEKNFEIEYQKSQAVPPLCEEAGGTVKVRSGFSLVYMLSWSPAFGTLENPQFKVTFSTISK